MKYWVKKKAAVGTPRTPATMTAPHSKASPQLIGPSRMPLNNGRRSLPCAIPNHPKEVSEATAQKATLSRGQSPKVDQSPADQTDGLMSQ